MAKKRKELDPTAQMVLTLKEGLEGPFWKALKALLTEEKEIAETAVFENEELDDKQRDGLRLRRNLLAYVIELPELVIVRSEPKEPQKEPDFETYDPPKV